MNGSENQLDAALQQVSRLIDCGSVREAERLAVGLARRHPHAGHLWYLLSEIKLRANSLLRAAKHAQKAVALCPENALYHVQLGRCLIRSGKLNGARQAAEAALKCNPAEAALLDGIGAILSHCEEHDRALSCFEKAAHLKPDNSRYLYNLATVLRMTGRLDEAKEVCDRVLQLNPHDYGAYQLRADLLQYSRDCNHIEQMENMLRSGTRSWQGEVALSFALAKECDDVGLYTASFRYLKRGCGVQRRHIQYRVDEDIATIDKIIALHTRESLGARQNGFNSEEPIFVIGLPRTGTTLVERILSCHSQVSSAGELNSFPIEITKAVQRLTGTRQVPKGDLVEASLKVDFAELGRAYIESTRPRTGRTNHFIDKMPQNYLYCGLIHAALPRAKVIHLDRNPMDTCYAIYRTLFRNIYPWSYDLGELGAYYLAYRRLMDHWRNVLGDALLDVQYEQLVADPNMQTRRMLEFCDLKWEASCLKFHESAEAASTASAVQVRKPLYTTSVNRWRRHECELRPLAELLERAGINLAP